MYPTRKFKPQVSNIKVYVIAGSVICEVYSQQCLKNCFYDAGFRHSGQVNDRRLVFYDSDFTCYPRGITRA